MDHFSFITVDIHNNPLRSGLIVHIWQMKTKNQRGKSACLGYKAGKKQRCGSPVYLSKTAVSIELGWSLENNSMGQVKFLTSIYCLSLMITKMILLSHFSNFLMFHSYSNNCYDHFLNREILGNTCFTGHRLGHFGSIWMKISTKTRQHCLHTSVSGKQIMPYLKLLETHGFILEPLSQTKQHKWFRADGFLV